MISVRPPLSSVMNRSASAFSRSVGEERRGVPDDVDEDDVADGGADDGCGTVLAPGKADGTGRERVAPELPPDCAGLDPDDDDAAPDASMPIA